MEYKVNDTKENYELNSSTYNKEKASKISNFNKTIDESIVSYIKATAPYNEEILTKYQDIIEQNYQSKIMEMIKKDVVKHFSNMKDYELNYFCKNVFILCSLKAYNINEPLIVKILMYVNNLFLAEFQSIEKYGEITNKFDDNINECLDYCTELTNKYIKIIKNEKNF